MKSESKRLSARIRRVLLERGRSLLEDYEQSKKNKKSGGKSLEDIPSDLSLRDLIIRGDRENWKFLSLISIFSPKNLMSYLSQIAVDAFSDFLPSREISAKIYSGKIIEASGEYSDPDTGGTRRASLRLDTNKGILVCELVYIMYPNRYFSKSEKFLTTKNVTIKCFSMCKDFMSKYKLGPLS